MKKDLNKMFLALIVVLSMVAPAEATVEEEINYLLKSGKKILVEGARTEDIRWDRACRLKRSSNYVAIVQSDGANYRIAPVPGGQIVEKICPSHIFQDALQWYKKLHKRRE